MSQQWLLYSRAFLYSSTGRNKQKHKITPVLYTALYNTFSYDTQNLAQLDTKELKTSSRIRAPGFK
jgi:hypothetical protein